MTLNSRALGCTVEIFAGGAWLLGMSLSLLVGWAKTTVIIIGSFHPFFSYSWSGAVIIALQHLISGFAVGYVFAVLYNKLLQYVSR